MRNNATSVAESVKKDIINRFALNKLSTRPVTQISRLTTSQESKARAETTKILALQRQPPLRRMQTQNTEYCCKQPQRSRQMTKEQNRLQSDCYLTMAVNVLTSQIAYDPGCN